MANREWVTLQILWKLISSHLFLWPTGSKWHCIFCERQSHHIFSYDQQPVSDIAYVSSHLFLWPTASEWHCKFCKRQSHHIFPYDYWTASEWHFAFCESSSHHIFSYDQQLVSDIAHFVKDSFITSFPMANSLWVTLHCSLITSSLMTNSLWVTLHILWKTVSLHLFL